MILTSSFAEIAFRINAQVYGGGTSNLKISAIGEMPIINVSKLSQEQQAALINSYNVYSDSGEKAIIDEEVYRILGSFE